MRLENILDKLDIDVLSQIFDYLQPNGALFPLSMTCRAIRIATMPILFSCCCVLVKEPVNEGGFLPLSLWPYVRTLYLIDKCPDMLAMRDPHRTLKFTTDRLLCGTLSPPLLLRRALRSMPRLRSVHLELRTLVAHGIGWDSITVILSTPQLRSFALRTYLLSPREAPPETWMEVLAPITTFQYDQPVLHSFLLRYPIQQDTLAFILPRLRQSLESLHLPSEVIPAAVMSQTQWPRLRELSLNGEFHPSVGFPTPLASLFRGMPGLRILNLVLALPQGVSRKQLMLWPEGYESRLPWPDLEALTLSFPDPEDRIFSHLPASLRRLSLRATPHHCLHLWEPLKYRYYGSPILYSSEMLEILTKISTPLLDNLQLEYLVDDAEDDLLQCIVDRFPNIQCLEAQRFRPSRHAVSVPVATVAQRLSALHSLRTLRAHLQPPHSNPIRLTPMTSEEYAEIYRSYTERIAALYPIAAELGSILRQPGFRLWLLQREECGAAWRLFDQASKQDLAPDVDAKLDFADGSIIEVCGF